MGKIIVIEGSDGAGKETQAKLLVENLQNKGYKVASLAFPRYKDTISGKVLYYLLGKDSDHLPDFEFSKLSPEVASLFYTADRVESKSHIEKLKSENDFLVLDRYYTANFLHQGAKFENEVERNNFIKLLSEIELDKLGVLRPDSVFYLSLPYEIAEKRLRDRAAESGNMQDQVEKDMDYIKRSIEKGESIAKNCGWKIINCEKINDIGEVEQRSREEISEQLLKEIN